MNEPVLAVRQLCKHIKGRSIVDHVSFEIGEGEIVGFLGPNGAGKTTTIRMLVDLIKPTSGKVVICGHHVAKEPEKALRYVGCIVENPEMYSFMSGWQNLEHFAQMLDHADEARIREVTEIVQLEDRIHDKVKTYSLGMRQRLGIAQALLGRPKLLILDEPTNGLDPKGIKELRSFIRQLASDGLSLLISSHLLSEVQMLCDRVIIIDQGKVIASGKIDELIKQAAGHVHWVLGSRDAGVKLLSSDNRIKVLAGTESADDACGPIVTAMREELIPETVRRLVEHGIPVHAVHRAETTLEEMFLAMTERDTIA
ncbi:ABC transporter ATP-binding protein [Paenibacillus nanensis]|uniref:ABC transporter ATP-binding protein n=1 Tax=Paenibacillus nanensis TaxID=393251 RepID=A0A3A1UYE4_9BACL|nr:ABC transporter ATP-binding protein [Paenibacillus nanensis]RIX53559.1 ABC transporter ATP-binding protein [Paenibacillus nanensis]